MCNTYAVRKNSRRDCHLLTSEDFETARVNYFDMLANKYDFPGDFMLPKGIGPVLRKTDVEFRSQLVRNDIIAIQHRISDVKKHEFLDGSNHDT